MTTVTTVNVSPLSPATDYLQWKVVSNGTDIAVSSTNVQHCSALVQPLELGTVLNARDKKCTKTCRLNTARKMIYFNILRVFPVRTSALRIIPLADLILLLNGRPKPVY